VVIHRSTVLGSNTQNRLREVLADLGIRGVTSHAFRRTVATLMDLAGLTARAAADQLGHAKVSMTTDVYVGRRVASTGAAAVLEAVGRSGAVDDEATGGGAGRRGSGGLTPTDAPAVGLEPTTCRDREGRAGRFRLSADRARGLR
jgi:hypothetical protein